MERLLRDRTQRKEGRCKCEVDTYANGAGVKQMRLEKDGKKNSGKETSTSQVSLDMVQQIMQRQEDVLKKSKTIGRKAEIGETEGKTVLQRRHSVS